MAGQLWGTATLGGNLSIGVLSKKLRHLAQLLMRADQFTRVEPAAGKNRGDIVYWNKISNVATAGGAINETQPVPITNITIARSSVTLKEYANGISFTGRLEALSDVEIEQVVLQPLRNDMAKTLNKEAMAEFQATYLRYIPTGTDAAPTGTFDTDGTTSTAATRDIQGSITQDLELDNGSHISAGLCRRLPCRTAPFRAVR